MDQNDSNYNTGIPELDSLLNEKSIQAIELRSEEVQEIMTRIPPWILRRGITLLFVIVLLLLTGSWFFKYPDVIQAEITVTSQEPPASVIARSTGKIDEIYVENEKEVSPGEPLAVIQNPANTTDMLSLLKSMEGWKISGYSLEETPTLFPSQSVSLGSIQTVYAAFLNSLNDYRNYKELNYYPQKIASQEEQLVTQKEYHQQIMEQAPVVRDQYLTSKNIFLRDSTLFIKEVISENEYEVSKNSFLQTKQAHLSFNASLKQSELQLMQGEESLLDLQQQASELESKYRLSLHNATEALNAQIKTWEHDYLMASPIAGIVNQMGIWSNNQNVTAGETVFTVVPSGQDRPKGKAMLPVQGAGKVKTGQRVNVRINNFPDQEFGYVIGKVVSISSVPSAEGFYVVEVDFPGGMKTNYDRILPLSRQMQGTADIITDDLRLIERFFMPVKKIINERL
ncbi:Multidrug resistance efflux pump [Porphyromonadaceae bacterium KH3R12]|uniref:HlyD family secretion protein n=1 Tax=Proteiniphilum saccharofermentans TaxID=1642647 RepID=UPI000899B309|nr:HlyD family efflux transporter periplasmic adaptor subunit [Proteiniphilum saccharofermentans]SEA01263.1 Multidrug resistance efflux pump [Porphyromonadaceae bacterium KH3R12]